MELPGPEALPHLRTERLTVRMADEMDVPAIVRYYVENRDHLRPFDPRRPAAFYDEEFWYAQVRQNVVDYYSDQALRLFLFAHDDPDGVIGIANFTNIVRGAAHFCNLGYSVAAASEGQGYMFEALRAAIAFVFGALRIHRIQANYMPHNLRSGKLLQRLGFVEEGLARDYLLIDGRWRDHVLTSLTNPEWRPVTISD
ncbi:MAG TPA: ribosomal protein S5-alanine N-acetyltransferase [Longimicrobiaceae bacterium]|nr:ribosomal protein S5-alanine N-acetyltransferase [Longimicrobiaceae bacterium]